MPNPDLSHLTTAQREEFTIGLLLENHAMLVTLLEDHVERLQQEHGMTTEVARRFIAKQVQDTKAVLIESLGLAPKPHQP